MGWVVCGVCQSVVGGTILLGSDIGRPIMGVPKGEMRTAASPYTTMLEAEFSDGTLQRMQLLSAV